MGSTVKLHQKCPSCHELIEEAICPQEEAGPNAVPEEGDVSICGKCGELALFDKELNLAPIEGVYYDIPDQALVTSCRTKTTQLMYQGYGDDALHGTLAHLMIMAVRFKK